ncbi:MAG: outer membrane lipoprotein-sorting protein [Thermodesulfobacteriota bacterium]
MMERMLRGIGDFVVLSSVGLIVLLMFLPFQASAMTAEEVMKKSQAAFLYPGHDFKARVVMKLITKDGKERIRELTMLRKNYGEIGGDQKYFIYFFQPADVRDMTFMVYKYPAKDDDRWLFVPAIDLVRRIAASDARSSFVGSDFTYEDVSGRDIPADTHTLLREEKLGDKDSYVVESVPKEPIDYVKRISWVDKTTFLPLKEEYYDVQKELARVFTADKIEEVAGAEPKERKTFATVTKRTMKNLKTGHRTEVKFSSTSYNIGLPDSIFTERYLRKPPERWIK